MAAKNKQRRRKKGAKKVTFDPEEKDMEAGNSGEAEDGATAAGGSGGGRAKPADGGGEEFNLDEVLKLGGTQVSPESRGPALPRPAEPVRVSLVPVGSHGSCLLRWW